MLLEYINILNDGEMLDLMVALDLMRYGDDSRLYEYFDKDDKRFIHLWDNEGSFKDNGQYYVWVNDYEVSDSNYRMNHNIYMLRRFGNEWGQSAQMHFEKTHNVDGLKVLAEAKTRWEEESSSDGDEMF